MLDLGLIFLVMLMLLGYSLGKLIENIIKYKKEQK